MASFLWSIRMQKVEKCDQFGNNILQIIKMNSDTILKTDKAQDEYC